VLAARRHSPQEIDDMTRLRQWILALITMVPACHCDGVDGSDIDVASSTWGASGVITGSSGEETGVSFDASRWIGNPLGSYLLANFEIFPDSTAVMLLDECDREPRTIHYEWTPDDEPGWLELHPGAGESSLRLDAAENLESVRVHLIEPCRELEFEDDDGKVHWFSFFPGASCWVDRCQNDPDQMQVDYCDGEEPPPCP
jgi:hypothetical protein